MATLGAVGQLADTIAGEGGFPSGLNGALELGTQDGASRKPPRLVQSVLAL
jgi:hypothetical protein